MVRVRLVFFILISILNYFIVSNLILLYLLFTRIRGVTQKDAEKGIKIIYILKNLEAELKFYNYYYTKKENEKRLAVLKRMNNLIWNIGKVILD